MIAHREGAALVLTLVGSQALVIPVQRDPIHFPDILGQQQAHSSLTDRQAHILTHKMQTTKILLKRFRHRYGVLKQDSSHSENKMSN